MSAQARLMHASTSTATCTCHTRQRQAGLLLKSQRQKERHSDGSRRFCVAMAQINGGQPQAAAQQTQEAQPNAHNAESARHWIAAWRSQAPNAKGADTKSNGARQNGSTPSNQAGQATAPKLPGEAPPTAKPKSQPRKGFNNVNKFIVPEDKVPEFEDAWHEREAGMQQSPGFLDFTLEHRDGSDFVATSKWASIPEWEAYSLSEVARRSHLPWGVYQYVPAKGEGFPEDFIPFIKMDNFVNAKY